MKVERTVITAKQVGEMLAVDPKTVCRWDRLGVLKCDFRTPGGRRRYYLDRIEALMGEQS